MLKIEQQIFEQIEKAENILITFRQIWNADAVGSALSLFLFLKKIGKEVTIIADSLNAGDNLAFFPAYQEIKNNFSELRQFTVSLKTENAEVSQIKYKPKKDSLDFVVFLKSGQLAPGDLSLKEGKFNYDLIIVPGTSDLESLGKIYEENKDLFFEVPVINIDHKPNNENFGQINLVKLTATSTAEILFSLFEEYGPDLIDEDIATCLLAGIISETRSFKTKNITPLSLLAASRLISLGGRREEIVNNFYRSKELETLKNWGEILTELKSDLDGKLVWAVVKKNEEEIKIPNLNEAIRELLVNLPQTDIIVLLYEELKDNKNIATALIYSFKNINLLDLLSELGARGSKNVAQISFDEPIKMAERKIISFLKEKLNKIL
jgi:phosphoesterase RecJ-like protein